MFHFNGKTYQMIHAHKDAWNAEAFRERYSEVLDRYDYIVGDWGYSQLRLKGFFKDNGSKASRDSTIAHLQDYLHEYCNFGCAYFILERVPNAQQTAPAADGTDSEGQSLDIEEGILKSAGAGVQRDVFRTDRPEHRENRHRFDLSLSRAKQEAAKQADFSYQQDGGDKRESNNRSGGSNRQEHGHGQQRKDYSQRQGSNHGGNGGGHNRNSNHGSRGEQGHRNDQPNRGGDGNARTEQGRQGDNRSTSKRATISQEAIIRLRINRPPRVQAIRRRAKPRIRRRLRLNNLRDCSESIIKASLPRFMQAGVEAFWPC